MKIGHLTIGSIYGETHSVATPDRNIKHFKQSQDRQEMCHEWHGTRCHGCDWEKGNAITRVDYLRPLELFQKSSNAPLNRLKRSETTRHANAVGQGGIMLLDAVFINNLWAPTKVRLCCTQKYLSCFFSTFHQTYTAPARVHLSAQEQEQGDTTGCKQRTIRWNIWIQAAALSSPIHPINKRWGTRPATRGRVRLIRSTTLTSPAKEIAVFRPFIWQHIDCGCFLQKTG